MNRVVVTGLGAVSPFGIGFQKLIDAAFLGHSAIRLETEKYDKPYAVASIKADLPKSDSPADRFLIDRVSLLALTAAGEAVDASGLSAEALAGRETGIFYGSGFGGASSIEEGYRAVLLGSGRPRPSTVPAAMVNAGASHVAIKYAITGPVLTYATACASSALAVGEAFCAIRNGRLRRAIAIGSEAILTNGLLAAWDSMRILAQIDASAPDQICRPFSRDRTGIVLGEGAAALVLESEVDAIQRGARIWAEVAGYWVTSDASHLTAPSMKGQYEAMLGALTDSGEEPRSVGYINAHATGTPVGDRIEADAITELFWRDNAQLAVSSTKAIHGHLLGAAGALELSICVGALSAQVIPPTMNFSEPDNGCQLDFVPNVARRIRFRAAMSNSFAFGGTNASIIVRERM